MKTHFNKHIQIHLTIKSVEQTRLQLVLNLFKLIEQLNRQVLRKGHLIKDEII